MSHHLVAVLAVWTAHLVVLAAAQNSGKPLVDTNRSDGSTVYCTFCIEHIDGHREMYSSPRNTPFPQCFPRVKRGGVEG